MKIRFVAKIESGDQPFVIDTNRFPWKIGNHEIELTDFEIIEKDAPLTSKSSRPDDLCEKNL